MDDRSRSGPVVQPFCGWKTIETEGGVQLELDKHDGIGLISAADLTTLTELYIAYFNRAADALGLSFWATAFAKNGFSFDEIADLFFEQPETVALYSGGKRRRLRHRRLQQCPRPRAGSGWVRFLDRPACGGDRYRKRVHS